MDLVEFISIIRTWKWLVITVMVVVIGLSVASGYTASNTYRAETTVVVGLSQIAATSSGGISVAQIGERIGATYSELVTGNAVLEKALKKAGLDWSVSQLKGRIATSTVKTTPVIKVSVSDTDADRAILLANAVSESLVEYIGEVGAQSLDRTREILTEELAQVDREIQAVSGQQPVDTAKLTALQERRDVILTEFEQVLIQKINTGDIRISDEATTYQVSGVKMSQRIAIGVIVSLIAGIATAFIAEAVQRSYED